MIYRWDEDRLEVDDDDGAFDYLAAEIWPTEIYLWPGRGTKGEILTPIPDGMEFGDDLKRYVEAQHRLMV